MASFDARVKRDAILCYEDIYYEELLRVLLVRVAQLFIAVLHRA